MKSFLLEKISQYLPYLENNLPIFSTNGQILTSFNFNYDEIVTEYFEALSKLHSNFFKTSNIVESSINDRVHDSRLFEYTAEKKEDDPSIYNSNVEGSPHKSINIEEIPIRADFSIVEGEESDMNEDEKIFIMTMTKEKKNFTQENFNFIDSMKLIDQDLEEFLLGLAKNDFFEGNILLSEHNLTDQTTIQISKILRENKPKIINLDFSRNVKMRDLSGVFIGEALKLNNTLKSISFQDIALKSNGANRLIESFRYNKIVENVDLGLITDESFKTLSIFLSEEHNIRNLSFGEDLEEKWELSTKKEFITTLNKYKWNRNLLSINIYVQDVYSHSDLLGNICLVTCKNRELFLKKAENDFNLRSLQTDQPEYFEEDNHKENMNKFSCKTYISNVFSTFLDEGLYYLEKERMNKLRDEEIAIVKKEKETGEKFLEDICTANGSILFLCQFLINNLKN